MATTSTGIATRRDCNSLYQTFSSDLSKCVTFYDIATSTYLTTGTSVNFNTSKKTLTLLGGDTSSDNVVLSSTNIPNETYHDSITITGDFRCTLNRTFSGSQAFNSYISFGIYITIGSLTHTKLISFTPNFSYGENSQNLYTNWSHSIGSTCINGGDIRAIFYVTTVGDGITWNGATCSINSFNFKGENGSDKLVKYVNIATIVPRYTFTISPTPSNATVSLSASGYSQSGNSITVPSGTKVSWSVSRSGYTSQSGTQTVTSNYTKYVTLSSSGGGGGTSPSSSSSRIGVWEPAVEIVK